MPTSSSTLPALSDRGLMTNVAVTKESGPGAIESQSAMLAALELLIGEPDPERPRYDREAFKPGADLDHDCVPSRHEVLIEEARSYTLNADGCRVEGGEWYDPFTDQLVTDPDELQVDHVVALADAWASGAWTLEPEEQLAFGNQLINLNAIHRKENERKSSFGPGTYSPSNPESLCSYLTQYATVKVRWGLSIDQRDFDAVADGLRNCDAADRYEVAVQTMIGSSDVAAAAEAPTTTSAVATTTTSTAAPTTSPPTTLATTQGPGCDPNYSGCVPIASDVDCAGGSGNGPAYVRGPVQVIGRDIYGLDGNNDGVGCE